MPLVGALREVVEVLNGLVGPHAAQLRALVGRPTPPWPSWKRERRRWHRTGEDRALHRGGARPARRKTAETVKALVDGVADKLQTATVIKAKAYSRTKHLRTTVAFAGAALALLAAEAAGGASLSGSRPPPPSDMWERCLRTARKGPSTGDVYRAMRVPKWP